METKLPSPSRTPSAIHSFCPSSRPTWTWSRKAVRLGRSAWGQEPGLALFHQSSEPPTHSGRAPVTVRLRRGHSGLRILENPGPPRKTLAICLGLPPPHPPRPLIASFSAAVALSPDRSRTEARKSGGGAPPPSRSEEPTRRLAGLLPRCKKNEAGMGLPTQSQEQGSRRVPKMAALLTPQGFLQIAVICHSQTQLSTTHLVPEPVVPEPAIPKQ